MNDYNFGNIIDPNVYYDYYAARSMNSFRVAFLKLATALQEKGNADKAIQLADKYFASFPISTDVLDPVSLQMSAIYINEKHKNGYKWSDLLLKEYKLQVNYLLAQKSKGNNLSNDGTTLLNYTQQCVRTLEGLRQKIKE